MPAGEENRPYRRKEKDNLESRAWSPEPGCQATRKDIINVIRVRAREINLSYTARERLLPCSEGGVGEKDSRNGRPGAAGARLQDLAAGKTR